MNRWTLAPALAVIALAGCTGTEEPVASRAFRFELVEPSVRVGRDTTLRVRLLRLVSTSSTPSCRWLEAGRLGSRHRCRGRPRRYEAPYASSHADTQSLAARSHCGPGICKTLQH
jgi:hypothetical protein